MALTKYGMAQIQTGQLIIVREDRENIYVPQDGEVEVRLNDVIRVGQDSFVILKTEEQTDIKMGSNAVFQIKPWKNRNKTGYLRMLYGKMNFETKKLQKRKRFRFKTASASIGVKGTGADCEVGSTGNTGCTGRSGNTVIQGNSGPSRDLAANQMSIVVGNRPASQTIMVPPPPGEDSKKDDHKTFAKASSTSNRSSSLSQEGQAVNAGIIGQESLNESKKEEIAADESLEQELEAEAQGDVEEDAETDEAFEEDLKESEENSEVMELAVNEPVDIAGQIEVAAATATTPEIPEVDVEEAIEEAVQESKNATGKLILDFEN